MEQARTMEKMGYGNGTVPHNGKYGNREWNGTAQWKIWKFGNGMVPQNEKYEIREWNKPEQWEKWDTGMERFRTMERMGYGNGTVPNNGKYRLE